MDRIALSLFVLHITALLLVTACKPEYASVQYSLFILSNGDVVSCADYQWSSCGIDLRRCKDQKEYMCQINVTRLDN